MGTSRETDAPPMLDLGCPEFYAHVIGRIEPAGGDNLRIYMCVSRGRTLEPIFSVVIPISELARCSRQCLIAASERHTELMMLPIAH